jgi:hypothetical protein
MLLAWLALGGVVLLVALALMQGFARASVATIRQALIVAGAALGTALLLALLLSGRLMQAMWALALVGPLAWRAWQGWRTARRFARGGAGGAAGAAEGETTVETATLAMTLHHGSGRMTGTVRRGRFAGADLAELDLAALLALLADCRAEDGESVPLLEAWLDRTRPDWRDSAEAAAGDRAGGGSTRGSPPPGRGGGPMSRAEALAVLGLAEGATEEEIRAAHRRLMRGAHPDRGGSDWLAARLNEARDTLLRA